MAYSGSIAYKLAELYTVIDGEGKTGEADSEQRREGGVKVQAAIT